MGKEEENKPPNTERPKHKDKDKDSRKHRASVNKSDCEVIESNSPELHSRPLP